MPLREFISSGAPFGRKDAGSLAYPQSWAIMHYLNRAKPKEVVKYVEILRKRSLFYRSTPRQEIADFETAFGKLDDRWAKKWKRWMKNVR